MKINVRHADKIVLKLNQNNNNNKRCIERPCHGVLRMNELKKNRKKERETEMKWNIPSNLLWPEKKMDGVENQRCTSTYGMLWKKLKWERRERKINQQKAKNSHIIKHINQLVWIHMKYIDEYVTIFIRLELWNSAASTLGEWAWARASEIERERGRQKRYVRTPEWLIEVSFSVVDFCSLELKPKTLVCVLCNISNERGAWIGI